MNKTVKKKLLLVVKIMISLLLMYYVFRKIDLVQLNVIIQTLHVGWIVIAILAFIVSKVLSSIRLNYFLKIAGILVSEIYNLKLYWLGMYYNLFLPGGIGGDGYKLFLLQRKFKKGMRHIFLSILFDRITGIFALFGLLVLLSFLLPFTPFFKRIIVMLLPVTIGLFYLFINYFFKAYIRIFLQTTALSFGVQVAQLISVLFILMALHHYQNLGSYMFVFLLSSVVAIIPFTIGGAGAREFTFLAGATWLHLDINISIAISLLFFLMTAFVSFWGIIYSFNEKRIFGYA